MSGSTSGRSRAEQRQRPPERCARCRKKVGDGNGNVINGFLVCERCAGKDEAH